MAADSRFLEQAKSSSRPWRLQGPYNFRRIPYKFPGIPILFKGFFKGSYPCLRHFKGFLSFFKAFFKGFLSFLKALLRESYPFFKAFLIPYKFPGLLKAACQEAGWIVRGKDRDAKKGKMGKCTPKGPTIHPELPFPSFPITLPKKDRNPFKKAFQKWQESLKNDFKNRNPWKKAFKRIGID